MTRCQTRAAYINQGSYKLVQPCRPSKGLNFCINKNSVEIMFGFFSWHSQDICQFHYSSDLHTVGFELLVPNSCSHCSGSGKSSRLYRDLDSEEIFVKIVLSNTSVCHILCTLYYSVQAADRLNRKHGQLPP
jgi:hypothetical protein